MHREDFLVTEAVRADRFASSLGLFTRSQITRRSVTVRDTSGQILKYSKRLKPGQTVSIEWDDPPSSDIRPEPVSLDIVYEDNDCLVINKKQGVVVHPSHGHYSGTLVQGLLWRYSEIEDAFNGDRIRPGIVHRLDKDTSGLLIAAKNPRALEFLSAQFRGRSVGKTYLAITRGAPSVDEGELNGPIGRDPHDRKKFASGVRNAKAACTRFRVLRRSGHYALVRVVILTGRTHQIRVHMSSAGSPVLGDPLYGRSDPQFPDAPLMLHSRKLKITLPCSEIREFQAPLPDHFNDMLKKLDMDGCL